MSPVLQPMTFEELSQVHREEMKVKALTSCRPDLYRAMADLLVRLRLEYDKQIARDPDSIMSEGASMQRKKAETLSKVIVSLRASKIAKKAVLSADGATEELSALTPEEREYYQQIVELSRRHLSTVDRYRGKKVVDTRIDEDIAKRVPEPPSVQYEVPEPETPVSEPAPEIPIMDEPDMFDDMAGEESFDDIPEPDPSSPQVPEPEVETPEQPKKDKVETVLLRVLEDIPPFAGFDRDYYLHKEDIVTLPQPIATALINANKAVAVTPGP